MEEEEKQRNKKRKSTKQGKKRKSTKQGATRKSGLQSKKRRTNSKLQSPLRSVRRPAADLHHARVSTDLPEALQQRQRWSIFLNLCHFSFFMWRLVVPPSGMLNCETGSGHQEFRLCQERRVVFPIPFVRASMNVGSERPEPKERSFLFERSSLTLSLVHLLSFRISAFTYHL